MLQSLLAHLMCSVLHLGGDEAEIEGALDVVQDIVWSSPSAAACRLSTVLLLPTQHTTVGWLPLIDRTCRGFWYIQDFESLLESLL